MRRYTTLKALEIKKSHPKSWDKLRTWAVEHITNGSEEGIDVLIETLLVYSPRFLFDFFDDQGIRNNIILEEGDSRHTIEELVFMDAFDLLEQKQ